jgi:hypothetical protein
VLTFVSPEDLDESTQISFVVDKNVLAKALAAAVSAIGSGSSYFKDKESPCSVKTVASTWINSFASVVLL